MHLPFNRIKILRILIHCGIIKRNEFAGQLRSDQEILDFVMRASTRIDVKVPIPTSLNSSILDSLLQRPENLNSKHKRFLRQGHWIRSPPYGYNKDRTNRTLVPNAESANVQLIYQVFLEVRKFDKVFKILQEQGIRMTRARLEGILRRSSTYAGFVKVKNHEFPGKHPAIISDQQAQKARLILDQICYRVQRKLSLGFFLADAVTNELYQTTPDGWYYLPGTSNKIKGDAMERSFAEYLDQVIDSYPNLVLRQLFADTFKSIREMVELQVQRLKSESGAEKSCDTDDIALLLDWKYFSVKSDLIDFGIYLLRNVKLQWERSDYWMRKELQLLIFPRGVLYDHQENRFGSNFTIIDTSS